MAMRRSVGSTIDPGVFGVSLGIFKELRTEPLPERRVAPEPERAATRPRGVPAPQQSSALDPESGG
jgi:hypothetical protein